MRHYYLKETGNPGKGSASRVSEAPDVKTSEDRLATTCWVPPHSARISNIPSNLRISTTLSVENLLTQLLSDIFHCLYI